MLRRTFAFLALFCVVDSGWGAEQPYVLSLHEELGGRQGMSFSVTPKGNFQYHTPPKKPFTGTLTSEQIDSLMKVLIDAGLYKPRKNQPVVAADQPGMSIFSNYKERKHHVVVELTSKFAGVVRRELAKATNLKDH